MKTTSYEWNPVVEILNLEFLGETHGNFLSFGSGSGGGSRHPSTFSGKGSSPKKDRKKKQEFHRHKIKYVEAKPLDFAQLRSRVTISLEKLGQQVFSAEPGGYDLQDWMRSFNFLLDDFEKQAGPQNLSKEYFDTRLALASELLSSVDTSDIDQEMERLQVEEDGIKSELLQKDIERRQQLEEERGKTSSRLDALNKEHNETVHKMNVEKKSSDKKIRDNTSSTSVFSRLFSFGRKGKASPNGASDRKLNSLELEADRLQNEIDKLEDERNLISVKADLENKELLSQESQKLESIKTRLGELQKMKSERTQVVEKRKQVTTRLSEIISALTPRSEVTPNNDPGALQNASDANTSIDS